MPLRGTDSLAVLGDSALVNICSVTARGTFSPLVVQGDMRTTRICTANHMLSTHEVLAVALSAIRGRRKKGWVALVAQSDNSYSTELPSGLTDVKDLHVDVVITPCG